MDHVTKALRDFLAGNLETVTPAGLSIASVLLETKLSISPAQVHDYEPVNLQGDDCPAICLGLPGFTKAWLADAWQTQIRWEVPIVAYMVFDDDENEANESRAIKRFARAIETLFEDRRFDTIPLPREPGADPAAAGPVLYYLQEPPIQSGGVVFEQVGEGAFLRRAELSWVAYENRAMVSGA